VIVILVLVVLAAVLRAAVTILEYPDVGEDVGGDPATPAPQRPHARAPPPERPERDPGRANASPT
jgi:hypothetical protein